MKKVIGPIVLWLLIVSFPGQLSSAPSESKVLRKAPVPPPTITPVASKLYLMFFRPNNRTCIATPSDQANPKYNPGAPALNTTNVSTYYCKVTIEPDAPTSMYTAGTYMFTWTKQGEYLDIKVPKEVGAKITVDFYENCNNCMDNQIARPVWHGTDILQAGQPMVPINLSYLTKLPC